MSKHLLLVIAVLSLVVAACGVEPIGQPTTTAVTEDPVTTAAIPEGQQLSYSLDVGNQYEYEVDLVQHIEMSATGQGAVLEEGVPGEAAIDSAGYHRVHLHRDRRSTGGHIHDHHCG